jgi:hypothetical protein
VTAAAAGWSPLAMPGRPAWLGERRQPPPQVFRHPVTCDPPYMHVCPGTVGRCPSRSIIPRHLPACPACAAQAPTTEDPPCPTT